MQDNEYKYEKLKERIKRALHRGQTQSQYLSFSKDEDGKAEAEATQVSLYFIIYLEIKGLR